MFGTLIKWHRQLRTDRRGVSIVEFALMLPLLMLIGAGGIELINYLLASQKIERIASVTADNISRNTLAPSERSFIDTFKAIDEIAEPFELKDEGRVIMTGVIGVPKDGGIVGKVVWQRCAGNLAGIVSTIGAEAADPLKWAEGEDANLPNGISILQNQLVVVSEVAYRYQPLISLAQIRTSQTNGIMRQLSIFVSRGQAFPYVTPSPNIAPATCK